MYMFYAFACMQRKRIKTLPPTFHDSLVLFFCQFSFVSFSPLSCLLPNMGPEQFPFFPSYLHTWGALWFRYDPHVNDSPNCIP